MAKAPTIASQIGAFASSKRCFTAQQIRDEFGPSGASAISALTRKGQLESPARGIYCLPGVHIDDPQLVALLAQTGLKPYSPEQRHKKGTAVERAARNRLADLAKRDEPRRQLLAYAKKHRIFMLRDVRVALGSGIATLATNLAQAGEELVVIQPTVYALPALKDNEEEIASFFRRRSDIEREITCEIDEFRRRYEQMPHLGTGGVTVNYWDNGKPGSDDERARKATLLRVYVNIPHYPTVYGQAKRDKGIAWKGKPDAGGRAISDAAAAALVAKIFDPVPTLFADLMKLVHDPKFQPKVRQRVGGHADFRQHENQAAKMFGCAYTMRDVAKLDPAKLSHPLPQPVTLLVDDREPDAIITGLRRVPNLNVVRTQLENGDYLVPEQMIFERKTTADLFASLRGTDRLIKQACEVHELGLKTTLIVEGGIWPERQMGLNHLYSTLSWLRYDKGHDIVETADERFTCYAIVQAIKHYIFGLSSQPRRPDQVKKRASSWSRRDQQIFGIRGWMTGISERRANALLDHFGSPAAITNASIEELMEIKGIGRSLAEDLYAILH
jgi:ERCC4-type nuclease